MKLKILLLSLMLLIPFISTHSESTYTAVADIDSFVYVCTSNSILILKRDVNNDLIYLNEIPFKIYNLTDVNNFNSMAIINDCLITHANDTLYLYSIADRTNPVLQDTTILHGIKNIEKFGDYLIVRVKFASTNYFFKVGNKIFELVGQLNFSTGYWLAFQNNGAALRYPYIFARAGNTINMYKLIESDTVLQMNLVDSLNLYTTNTLFGINANSSYVYRMEYYYDLSVFPPKYWAYAKKAQIGIDTLIDVPGQICLFEVGIPVSDNWQMTGDNYGINGWIYKITECPSSRATMNIGFGSGPFSHFLIMNSIYRVGDNTFYYFHSIVNGVLTFKQFIKPPVGVLEYPSVTNHYSLTQNYPNPFNPTTKIRYSIPQSSPVIVKVFDVLGNEIETLVNEEKEAGYHSVDFNGSGLPSGVYLYQLRADAFVGSKKMLLLK